MAGETQIRGQMSACKLPEYGALSANTRIKCPTCAHTIVWDSPYGEGRWVHTGRKGA